jgi:hypothetical protein
MRLWNILNGKAQLNTIDELRHLWDLTAKDDVRWDRSFSPSNVDSIGEEILKIYTAFSQEHDNKVYVTHKIRENSDEVYDAIMKGATVFISGSSSKMPSDVRKALIDVIVKHSNPPLSAEKVYLLLSQMEKQGRYIVDAWPS